MKSRTNRRASRVEAPVRNFHVPLPATVYEALRREAEHLRRPATAVAREAIEMWLEQRRRTLVREAIAAYAVEHAGSPADLDPTLERASLELLRPRTSRR